jgi:type II secretory pathway component GspD/PulD (secretin)
MLLTKLKIVTAVLLGGIVLGTGITKAGQWAFADQGITSENLRSKHEKSGAGIAPAKPRAAKDKGDLESKLNSTITLNFKDTPLRQVLDDLREWTGMNIVIDSPILEAEGLSLDRKITMKIEGEGVTVKTALRLLLHQTHMDYNVKEEILTVTTPSQVQLTFKAFCVADLVWAEGVPGEPLSNKLPEALIRIITKAVEPESWDVMGGRGTIDFFPIGASFSVNQTPEIHERIQALLNGLREMKDQEEEMKKKKAAQQAEKKPK